MEVHPWDTLNSRYGREDEAQFLIFVEQLHEAGQLAASGALSKLRMALVAADNLAEVMLHRHKTRVVRLAGEGHSLDVPRLDARELRELKGDFGARVKLARQGGGEGMASYMLSPLLDERDDAIFRTAHAYRNRVYHADHHNPAALPLLTRAYLCAVGRAFVRHQPTNVGSSPTAATRQLAGYGYEPENNDRPGGPSFWPSTAASQITHHLTDDLEVTLEEAREALKDDLTARTAWADAMVTDLLEQGMPTDRLLFSLRWGEFWDTAGIDPDIVRLDRELADDWQEGIRSMKDEEPRSFDRHSELPEARNARGAGLAKEFKGKFDLREIGKLRRLADRLSSARDLSHLFDRYRRLDERMELIEQRLEHTAIGWDRYIEQESERMRGK